MKNTRLAAHSAVSRATLLTLTVSLALAVGSVAPAFAGKKEDKQITAQLKLGYSLYQSGRLREALGTAERLVKESPRSVEAHLLRGMILYNMNEQKDALIAFDRTIALDQNHTDARIYRGSALANLNRLDEAMAEYQKALEDLTYPQPERIHVNIAKLHRSGGQPQKAIESLQKATSFNMSYANAWYELGLIYDEIGKPAEALRAYQDALVGMDDRPELHLRLGKAHLAAGNLLKAREHFQKVTHLAPNGPEAAQARDQIAALRTPS